MRLSKCTDTHGQHVVCAHCGAPHKLDESTADLDGEPFRAYYCPTCATRLRAGELRPEEVKP